ncbi:MAG TPA: ATP synthase F1 subunit epsilon, partial [Tepidisphaeraceae bacterium]|nr:ATP synthase F1 subunit epsilon [Tepidisphaeraceae bacterium]
MAFQCVVVTPEAQTLDAQATQAIVPAWDGQIGILAGRAPLLMKLGLGSLRIDLAGGQSRRFFIDGGIAQMKDNRLTILTNEAVPTEEIDVNAANADYATAEASAPTDAKAREERTHQLRRARMKQELAGAR